MQSGNSARSTYFSVIFISVLACSSGADPIDALVAEEMNCTLVNQTADLRRACKKDVIERMFLYIEMQQLWIARKRERREDEKILKEKAFEEKQKKERDANEAAFRKFCMGLLVLVVFLLCIAPRPT
jgi:hypothetical protein